MAIMEQIKIFECSICRRLIDNNFTGIEKFTGTRKDVRKHIVEEHHIKGRHNTEGKKIVEFGPSFITSETISRVF
jgi:hypothetical protein